MEYYEFIFESLTEEKKDVLLALLGNIGFEGFEEEGDRLKAYILTDHYEEILFNNIIEQTGATYLKSVVENINWNQQWEAGFSPVLVTNPVTQKPFAAVRANFHEPSTGVLYDLVITPKMSFGTGHHATTFLMISEMSLLDFKGKSVVDFGTGTGVLAILAEKMGAGEVIAIDYDDWSINNTRENMETNACNRIKVVKASTIDSGIKADIMLANINLNIIIENLHAIKAACKAGSAALFSGILVDDQQQIINVLKDAGFSTGKIVTKDNWLVICTIAQ